jgi:hypothetical protein
MPTPGRLQHTGCFDTLGPRHRLTGQQVWVEQKEDYRFDEYGNRIPDRYFRPEYASVPRPYRTRL